MLSASTARPGGGADPRACGRDAERTSRRSASPASARAAVTAMSSAATPGTSAVMKYLGGLAHLGVERVRPRESVGVQRDPREVLDVVEGVQVRGVGAVRAPVPLGGAVIKPAMQRRVEGVEDVEGGGEHGRGSAVVSVWCRWCCVRARARVGREPSVRVSVACARVGDGGGARARLLCVSRRNRNGAKITFLEPSRRVASRRFDAPRTSATALETWRIWFRELPHPSSRVRGMATVLAARAPARLPPGPRRRRFGRATESRRAARGRSSARVPDENLSARDAETTFSDAPAAARALVRETPLGNRERDHPG